MAIVLVRHGETASNAQRVLQYPETPLSDRGLAQARRVADRLAHTRIAEIAASDYARALSTAELIRDASGAPLAIDPELRERNFGDLRGRAYADLGFDPFAPGYTPPAGESWEDLDRRVDRMWDRVAARAPGLAGDLVLVTHGLVCHSLVSRRIDLGGAAYAEGRFGNTSVTIVDAQPPWRLRLLACVAHLDSDLARDPRAAGIAASGP
ncbi:MAG TPA: histidine phosphatase family protein [Myxococcota bacterium]|nr:histidine phosphatase family protein [Myxococcota bacterium]